MVANALGVRLPTVFGGQMHTVRFHHHGEPFPGSLLAHLYHQLAEVLLPLEL